MTITHPHFDEHGSFAGLRLGALPPKRDARTLQFAKYVDDAYTLPKIPKTLHAPAGVTWPMYGNDRLGDCTVAAAGHMIQAWTSFAGRPVTPTDADVEAAYWGTGTADDGRVEIDVLNYWRKTGIGGDRIGAYVQVNSHDLPHVRAAIYLFGGVYAGIALPLSAQRQSKWSAAHGPDSAAGSWGGHAVPFVGYTASTFTCVTWGHPLVLTNGFNDAYTDEVYAIVSKDFLNEAGVSPAGFDFAALSADLAAISG